MKILAIETTTEVCGIGLHEDGESIGLVEEIVPRGHAKKLPLFYQELKAMLTLNLAEIDGIAVSIGPGSFTGLRIGLSYGKGLAYSHGLPIIPVPTLMSMTFGAKKCEGPVRTLLYSHGVKVYSQDFRWEGNDPVAMNSPTVKDWSGILPDLGNYSRILHWGCEKMLQGSAFEDKSEMARPSARWIGTLAHKYYSEWMVADPKQLVPEYITSFVTT